MKMNSNFRVLILCCLALGVVQSYGELVILYHSNVEKGNITCLSEDDSGSALIWNDKHASISDGFTPKRPESGNVRACGVRSSSDCPAEWDTKTGWEVVNSMDKPTGPVSDHRYEDFRKFAAADYVGEVKSSPGTMWFSASPIVGFNISICERKDPISAPCIWIFINAFGNLKICIETRNDECSESCENFKVRNQKVGLIHTPEWHTFKIEWESESEKIEIFEASDPKPLFSGTIPSCIAGHKLSHVSIGYDIERKFRHLRFHIFDYYFTGRKNAVISTKGFNHSGKIFHADLLVGICPKCRLIVHLVDEDDSNIETWVYSGDQRDPYKGLLAWRLVKLNTTFVSDSNRFLKFKIETILDEDEETGQWAIDNFRIYESAWQSKRSDLTFEKRNESVSCQKISHTGVVRLKDNSSPRLEDDEAKVELKEFLRQQNVQDIGKHGLICNPNGCICGRGFTGDNCTKDCDKGFYGYNCEEKCGSCQNLENCDSKTGFCQTRCDNNTSPPLCRIGRMGFAGELELIWNQDSKYLIEGQVPAIVNATGNTWATITVNGMRTCVINNHSGTPLSPITLRSWVTEFYRVENAERKKFYVSGTNYRDKTWNCSLLAAETYTIVIHIGDKTFTESSAEISSKITLTRHLIDNIQPGQMLNNQHLAGLAILPALAVCLLVSYIRYRRSRRKELRPALRVTRNSEILEPSPTDNLIDVYTVNGSTPQAENLGDRQTTDHVYLTPRVVPGYLEILEPLLTDSPTDVHASVLPTPQTEGLEDRQTTDHVYTVPNEPDSCSVSMELFETYVKNGARARLFNSQFMKLTVDLTKPCEYGRLPENIQKNRYENLIAYDETRVVLKRIHDDPKSDYINASYIGGYQKDRAYIATQGPMADTVNDFWRMIWQEDVRVICMLTNVVEDSMTLCEQYWPETMTRIKYGDILISKVNERNFADYTFRTFNLCTKEDTRKVTHLHYTGWPSPGLPMYPQSLVAYLKRLRDIPARNGPVVVHCHNGDDRTGTIILADICIHQGAAERVIDAVAAIRRIRDDRANLVGTPQQFLLAHILIMESLAKQPTQILCTKKLSGRIRAMKMQLESDMQRLDDTMWQEKALQSFATVDPRTGQDLVEPSPSTMENSENPIGAVSVDGVRVKGQYLASWLPPPLSLRQFWKFVVKKNTKLIIILQCSDPQSPSCCDIIPDEPTLLDIPQMEVQPESNHSADDHFKTEKILLTEASKDEARLQSVTVLTCGGWGAGENGKPPKTEALVSLWEASEKIPRKEGETLVLCHDGVTGCGLYLALSFMLERMAVERECDVFSAVRAVRRSRPQFVRTSKEFEYLYDAAVTYAEHFATYSNFS